MPHGIQVAIACDDPTQLASFWAAVLDYVLQPPPDGFVTWEDFANAVGIPNEKRNDISAVVDPSGAGPRILFERYDGGAPNQRLHIDINSVDGDVASELRPALLAAERLRLEALGATYKRQASGMAEETWIEMYDPEGNWFCVQ